MHPNAALLTRFYEAFARRDAEGMVACYHPDVDFSDPVFPALHGDQARGMWRMLCHRGQDLEVVFSGIEADDNSGQAHWEATYTFSQTGKKVHNVIDASFDFKDGLIIRHTDRFDLWRWAGQALGLAGKLLGWAPPLQNTVRKNAAKALAAWMSRPAR